MSYDWWMMEDGGESERHEETMWYQGQLGPVAVWMSRDSDSNSGKCDAIGTDDVMMGGIKVLVTYSHLG